MLLGYGEWMMNMGTETESDLTTESPVLFFGMISHLSYDMSGEIRIRWSWQLYIY